MTCVAGIVGPKGVWLAADKLICAGSYTSPYPVTKLIELKSDRKLVLAITGCVSVSEFLRRSFVPPKMYKLSLPDYLVKSFIPEVFVQMEDNHSLLAQGLAKVTNDVSFLISDGRQIVEASLHGDIEEVSESSPLPFSACGAGAAYALGYLCCAFERQKIEDFYAQAEELLRSAVMVSSIFSAYCGKDADVVFLPRAVRKR